MVTTAYFVRHGESCGNTDGFFQGRSDCDLSKNGLLQLEVLKERFKTIDFDAVYSSPLKRTLDTAKAVNYYHKLPIELDEGLIEIDGGIFEGMSFTEFKTDYPEDFEKFSKSMYLFDPENGESVKRVYDRMRKTVDGIVRKNIGKTIVLVSHGCAIKNYICYATGTPLDKIGELAWSDNTAVSKINFDEKFNPQVEFINDASHLAMLDLKKPEYWGDKTIYK